MNTSKTRFRGVFKNLCVLVFWAKVALALEGLTSLHLECATGPTNSNITFQYEWLLKIILREFVKHNRNFNFQSNFFQKYCLVKKLLPY